MAYVDLNPVRAGMARTPEASDYTGAQRRIQARQAQRKAAALARELVAHHKRQAEAEQARIRAELGPEHGLWLAPCLRATSGSCDLDDYLTLVDETGRLLRSDKRGAIPARLAPILERLDIDVDRWLTVMLSHGQFIGTAVGALTKLVTEATKRGLRWIRETTNIHRDRRPGRPPPQNVTA